MWARPEERPEILYRLREHHEFPGHAVVARVEKILLQALELDVAEHRAARIVLSSRLVGPDRFY